MLVRKLEDMPWYELSVEKQRDYAHLLNGLQNSTLLHIGPIGELSFQSFAVVM